MTIEDYRKLRLAEHFQPFLVRLRDGRSFLVERPELSMQSRSGKWIYVALRDGGFERIEIGSISEIAPVEENPKGRRRAS